MAQALFEHRHQPRMQALVLVVGAQVLRLAHRLGGVQPLDQMPGRQIEEHAAGHFAPALAVVAQAQQRLQQFEIEPLVEVGTADVHARGRQHVDAAVRVRDALRPQAHDGEVGSTTAYVDHQHHRFTVQALLIVERRGNRFELELHFGKARAVRGFAQRAFGQRVALGVVIDEMHRPAQHHALGHLAQLLLGAGGQMAQKQRNDVLVAHQIAVHHGLVLQQRAAQQALERAHQPPLLAFEVLGHGVAAVMGAQFLGMEEQGRGHGQHLAFQRNQAGRVGADTQRHRRVGGAEINAEGAGKRRSHQSEGRSEVRAEKVNTGCGPAGTRTAKTKTPTEKWALNVWLREKDLNLRPLGYEPNELPDCSIARYFQIIAGFSACHLLIQQLRRLLQHAQPAQHRP